MLTVMRVKLFKGRLISRGDSIVQERRVSKVGFGMRRVNVFREVRDENYVALLSVDNNAPKDRSTSIVVTII